MQTTQILKTLGVALPVFGLTWKWLRTHNDHTVAQKLDTPARDLDDRAIGQLIRDGKKIEAIKAIRQQHHCDLRQAKQHLRTLETQLQRH